MPEPFVFATDFELLRAENERFQTDNAHLSAEVKRLCAVVEKLTFQLAMLKRMQFGRKSEALSAVMGDLFGAATELEQPATPAPAPPRKASREAKAAPRVTLPPNLPVETIEIDLPPEHKCDAEGKPLRRIGEEVSDRLAVDPGRWYIKRTIRPKYANPALPEDDVQIAPLPARIIDGGLFDESVLADIAIRKFDDHLPLHRFGRFATALAALATPSHRRCAARSVSEIYYRDGGVDLAKQTLSDAVLACASWLAPLSAAVLAALKADRVLHVDETVLPLLAPGKTIKARAWAYVGTTVPLIYYDFTLNKAGQHVRERLAGWGDRDNPVYLQADRVSRAAAMRRRSLRSRRRREATEAASNYDGLYAQSPHIREVACWAHARRLLSAIHGLRSTWASCPSQVL